MPWRRSSDEFYAAAEMVLAQAVIGGKKTVSDTLVLIFGRKLILCFFYGRAVWLVTLSVILAVQIPTSVGKSFAIMSFFGVISSGVLLHEFLFF